MKWIKKVLSSIFIDGLTGMGLGLFATLIIGTIIKQVGDLSLIHISLRVRHLACSMRL